VLANAAPRPGDVYLRFNGLDNYVEIPSIADYSIATTGELAVAAWIRPDALLRCMSLLLALSGRRWGCRSMSVFGGQADITNLWRCVR
jgi:hypothetical protein